MPVPPTVVDDRLPALPSDDAATRAEIAIRAARRLVPFIRDRDGDRVCAILADADLPALVIALAAMVSAERPPTSRAAE